jgi:hypothetical protein
MLQLIVKSINRFVVCPGINIFGQIAFEVSTYLPMEKFEASSFHHGNSSGSLGVSVGANDGSTGMGAVPVTCPDLYLSAGSPFS